MSYAGYQRYEVPEIGGNVAKIMLAQQEQEAKRMSAAELAAYRQKKLEAEQAKAAGKEAKDIEKQIDTDATELRKTNLDIPATGYNNFDAMILGLAQKTTADLHENAKLYREKGGMYLPEYNQNKQWLNGVSGRVKNTVSSLDASLEKIEKSKNPNVFVKHFLGQTMQDVTPTEQNKISLLPDVGTKSISFVTYGPDGNPVKKPLESLNAIAALSDFDAPDYEADMKKLVDGVGVVAKEVKMPGGGSKVTIDPKSQENFARTRKVYVNSVLNRPVVAADAYMKFVSTPGTPALFVKESATEEEKEMIARQNGYDSAQEADFVVYGTNDKTGLPEIKLTEKQEVNLRKSLAQAFTDKSPYKESFALPSTTNINVTMPNPERETGRTRTDFAMNLNTEVGMKAALSGLQNAQAKGRISGNSVIVKGADGKPTGEIIYYKKIGEFEGYPKFSKEPTVINVSNPDDAEFFRIEFGEISDAREDQSQQESTHPKRVKIK